MVNLELLKEAIAAKGLSLKDLSEQLAMNPSTLYRKIYGYSDFFRAEIKSICLILEISDPRPIFFAESIAKTQSKID